jgi:hypothetical protein
MDLAALQHHDEHSSEWQITPSDSTIGLWFTKAKICPGTIEPQCSMRIKPFEVYDHSTQWGKAR